jgi:hypothetical protein
VRHSPKDTPGAGGTAVGGPQRTSTGRRWHTPPFVSPEIAVTTQVPALSDQDQIFGHPKGLYVCFLTEMWERFAFYGMKALLFLYLTKHHLFTDTDGYLLLGTYAGLAYALPLLGGLLADRYLGMRRRWCSAASCWCWASWAWPTPATRPAAQWAMRCRTVSRCRSCMHRWR